MENLSKKTSILQFQAPNYTPELVKDLFNQSNNDSARFTQLLNAFVRNHYKAQPEMTEEILEQAKITEANAKHLAKQAGLSFKKKSFKQTLVLSVSSNVTNSIASAIPTLEVEENEPQTTQELFDAEKENNEEKEELNDTLSDLLGDVETITTDASNDENTSDDDILNNL